MAQKRVVNIIPHVKIKKEVVSDEEEDCVTCCICNKAFASEVALRNHARMEHVEAYLTGDPAAWTLTEQPKKDKEIQKMVIKQKTERIISAMAPTDLASLASEDVSYIIVKAEDVPGMVVTPRKRIKVERDGEKAPAPPRGREKEIQPITGPFECLQPSGVVADGTCHQIFFSCCEYSAHFRDEHTRRRKGLRCQVCEKPLSGGDDQAPFSCEVCGAGFGFNKELSSHMAREHVKLKPFECKVCHKRFTQQGGVVQHMRMHTGDRPFPCTFCPKAFTQKSGLDQHLRIHTKVKPYRCVICSKTFCQSVHLRQHMRTHTQVSPFQCGICQKRFKQSSHLNYHLKNHDQNMTPEQRQVYSKLVSMMGADQQAADRGSAEGVCVVSDEAGMSTVEVCEETEVTADQEEFEETEVLMDEHEQLLAEQSIQTEEEGGETYILSDVRGS